MCHRFRIIVMQAESFQNGIFCKACHVIDRSAASFNGNRWGVQQDFSRQDQLFLLSFFWQLLDNQICQLFQQLRERQQQERNNHIEDGVHQSNTSIANRPVHKDEVYKRIDQIQNWQQNNCADAVECDVNDSNSSRTAVNTNAGNQSSDTSSDILSHNNRDCHAIGDMTCN